jgi:hypothetical protein
MPHTHGYAWKYECSVGIEMSMPYMHGNEYVPYAWKYVCLIRMEMSMSHMHEHGLKRFILSSLLNIAINI